MVYVTMTDKFMSGWGMAKGKTNKLVIECNDYEQASKILANARKRPEMKYISVAYSKPCYRNSKYLVSWKLFSDMTGWIK